MSLQICKEICCFLEKKIYTAGKHFTRPPVVTVAKNLNSDCNTPIIMVIITTTITIITTAPAGILGWSRATAR